MGKLSKDRNAKVFRGYSIGTLGNTVSSGTFNRVTLFRRGNFAVSGAEFVENSSN